MKNYFIFFCLCLSPIFSHANEQKFSIIQEAEWHKKKMVDGLAKAKDMCVYIPDLANQENMRVLIGSAAAASFMGGDLKTKFLSVGFALIATLATDMYDRYREYRDCLAEVAYHMEMNDFYSSLSLKLPQN